MYFFWHFISLSVEALLFIQYPSANTSLFSIQSLPFGYLHSATVGKQDKNESKNRYDFVMPCKAKMCYFHRFLQLLLYENGIVRFKNSQIWLTSGFYNFKTLGEFNSKDKYHLRVLDDYNRIFLAADGWQQSEQANADYINASSISVSVAQYCK